LASLLEELRLFRGRLNVGADIPQERVEFAQGLGIIPDPWQRDLLTSTASRVMMNCSRQSGKSVMAAIIALHKAMTQPRSLVLLLAPSERQSKELMTKVTDHFRTLRGVKLESDRKLGMLLPNGSRIEALPGTEKTIRGFSGVALLVVDEASRIDDGLYYAVRPMMAVSGGSMVMLSSPYGKRGVFYEEWQAGERWERYEVPASECPRISEEFLKEERQSLPAWVFRQEYMCSFEEVEDAIFTTEMIEASFTDTPEDEFEGSEDLWS
jgi:hypothetical protein